MKIPGVQCALLAKFPVLYSCFRMVYTAVYTAVALSLFKRRVEPNMEGFGSTRLLNVQVPVPRGTIVQWYIFMYVPVSGILYTSSYLSVQYLYAGLGKRSRKRSSNATPLVGKVVYIDWPSKGSDIW